MSRVATLRRCFPTLLMLGAQVRWVGKSRRRLCATMLVTLAVIASPPLWWATQLVGLPDIGDPFDVGAFQSLTVPDDRNAFVLYGRAAELFNANAGRLQSVSGNGGILARWSEATTEVRHGAEENRAALELYRRGTERPDALDPSVDALDPSVGVDLKSYKTIRALWYFCPLALLEASRLEENGDMAGAWDWYRAVVRTIRHVGMHGAPERRNMILHWHRELRNRVMVWADDAKTTPALLRRALDDVVACEALAPSERDSLKAGYLELMALLESPRDPGRQVPLARFRRFWNPNYTLTPQQLQELWDTWRFWRREPERTRRLIRLITANWLAYLDLPAEDRPKPDPEVASFAFYRFGKQSPAQARALTPETLDRWFGTAEDAQKLLRYLDGSAIHIVEQANHADLLDLLATALYHREHGTDPPTPDALVGPYLKSLPVEYFDKQTQIDRSTNELNWWRQRRSTADKGR